VRTQSTSERFTLSMCVNGVEFRQASTHLCGGHPSSRPLFLRHFQPFPPPAPLHSILA
jgi:hypothetical protein